MTINFKGNSCSLIGNHGVIGYANRIAGLFHLRMVVHHENANLVSTLDDRFQSLDTWHRRLCHVSENTIRQMVDNNAVSGIKLKKGEHEGKCVECIEGKMHAKPSPARTTRELVPGAIIHSDLEFMIDETFKRATYCLKFVDEASGYVWVYPIKDKTHLLSFTISKSSTRSSKINTRPESLHFTLTMEENMLMSK